MLGAVIYRLQENDPFPGCCGEIRHGCCESQEGNTVTISIIRAGNDCSMVYTGDVVLIGDVELVEVTSLDELKPGQCVDKIAYEAAQITTNETG